MAFRHPSPAGRNKKASPGASAPPPWAQPQRGTPTSQGGGSLDEDDEIADDASYLDPGDLEVPPASEVGRGFFRAVVPMRAALGAQTISGSSGGSSAGLQPCSHEHPAQRVMQLALDAEPYHEKCKTSWCRAFLELKIRERSNM